MGSEERSLKAKPLTYEILLSLSKSFEMSKFRARLLNSRKSSMHNNGVKIIEVFMLQLMGFPGKNLFLVIGTNETN